MSEKYADRIDLPDEIARHFASGQEAERLECGPGRLERARTQELLQRYLPPSPADVLDVGGGTGVYAFWLAERGYRVRLVDPVPGHIEAAQRASAASDYPLTGASVGDARRLDAPDSSVDAALLFGPLYHLTEREDRHAALTEALRVLRPGGRVFVVGISRFASALDGLFSGYLDDPAFAEIVARDLRDGQHRNPDDHPEYFTTAFFHLPGGLREELEAAGFTWERTLGIEGPGWLLADLDERWNDAGRRACLLDTVRALEERPELSGLSAHLMAVGRKRGA